MPSNSRWRAPLLRAIVPLALAGLAVVGRTAATTPMTLEDVVRLHVSGESVETIVAQIRSSPVEFDLAEEMLEELAIAGIPQAVIEAMIARQRELHPPAEGSDDAGGEVAAGQRPLSIRLRIAGGSDGKGDRPALRALDRLGPEARAALQLSGDDSRITDLALFVACTTPTHVPDHWRGESALGRDFVSMPRHKLLAFLPGASRGPAPARAPKDSAVLALELPELVEIPIEGDEPHDLLIGLAIRAEERYFRIASAAREEFRPADHGMVLDVELRPSKSLNPSTLEIRFPTAGESGGDAGQ